MAPSITDMRLLGGHPALDFVNTVDSRRGRWGPDLLRDFGGLLAIADRAGLLDGAAAAALRVQASAKPDAAEAAFDQAVALREAIHTLFLGEEAGIAPPSASVATVEAAAREGRGRARLRHTVDGYAWCLTFDALDDVALAFAAAAAELLISQGERRAVRECKGENCGWLFLDRSKSGRRIWCSEATCGARSRIRRFRAQPT